MKKTLAFLILFLITYNLQLTTSYADTVSSDELISNAEEFDGKRVMYKGEAVTAVLNHGEYSWVNLNDGRNAIGVWCKSSQLSGVRYLGDYKNKGDILEVYGVFKQACPVHGGELDIHAERVTVVKPGHSVKHSIDTKKATLSIGIFLLAFFVMVLSKRRA